MFKVITMTYSNYFGAGKLFLKTRNRIDADFILYGPDLTGKQIDILRANNVSYIKVDENIYKTNMQFLKFPFIKEQIELDVDKKYKGFTFTDFDTFFINDWKHVFEYEFDFGITIRNDQVRNKCFRAYANGGVMFAKHSAKELLLCAEKVILDGNPTNLPEYNIIWNTLEKGRPKHKTHYRTVLRWWCDQIFIASLALNYFNKNGYCKIGATPIIFDFERTKIGMFGCEYYNVIGPGTSIDIKKNIYIKHLKARGRKSLGVDKTVEKLNE